MFPRHHLHRWLCGLLVALAEQATALRLGGSDGRGACPVDLDAWTEQRVKQQLAPWAKTGITEEMFQHARAYKPNWMRPGVIELKYQQGEHIFIVDGLDVGTRGWFNYTKRAVAHWPFEPGELKEFKALVQKGDFPMLLKDDPNAVPNLNAPLFTNTNNGKFYEIMMPASWRPQFDYDFAEKKAEALLLARQHPWKHRKDVATWRGVIGCATGCGERGKNYFPDGTVEVCSDDFPNWDANAVGATWGCGDDNRTNSSSAWMKHPRVQLVSRFADQHGEPVCSIDAGFHAWQRHGAFLRKKVDAATLNSWMKDFVSDEETASHKYVFLVGNNGYTDRSWRMFALGAVVLMMDSGWEEFYFPLLRPWEHYIPVRADASDACERVQWAQQHPEEAERIARNGRDFIQNCFTESFVDRYVAEVIRQLGSLWELGKEKR